LTGKHKIATISLLKRMSKKRQHRVETRAERVQKSLRQNLEPAKDAINKISAEILPVTSEIETEVVAVALVEAEIPTHSPEISILRPREDEIDYQALEDEIRSFPSLLQELAFSIARGEPLRTGSSQEIIESPKYSVEGVSRAISVGIKLQYPYLSGKERG